MTQFKVGSTYQARSICQHDCIFSYKVIGRTAKMVTLDNGNNYRVKIWEDTETIKPEGTYSMAPTLRANRELV